jgi:ABC-2 type transport system permease protein
MSRWTSLWLVAGRELREAFRRRSFWVVIGLLVAASTAGVMLPEILGGDRTSYDVAVVDGSPELDAQLQAVARSLDVDIELSAADDASDASQRVADDRADVAIVTGAQPTVIAKQDRAESFVAAAQQVVAVRALADRLEDAGLTRAEVDRSMERSQAKVVRLDQDESSRKGSAALVAIALYLLLLMLMIQVSNGTAIEKANRISEVLLAIVRPGALLFGKVVGVGLVGLLTLAFGLLPVIVKLASGGDLPAGLGSAIAGGAPWLVLGLVLYLTTAGALGALVERQEEAGSVVSPLTFLLIASYLVAQSASDTPLGQALAIIPFTSPMVMPSRIAVGEASGIEITASLVLGLATVLLAVRVGSRIYSRAIVRTGRRLKLREVLT